MIYIGENEITNIMIGDTEIYGIYAGDLQIYPTDFGTLTGITIEDLVWVKDIPQSGGTATADNCFFRVMAHYDSGKSRNVKSRSTITGSLVVPASTAETREMVGTLTLTADYEGFTDTDSVDVYQMVDYSLMPLTFEITSDGVIKWERGGNDPGRTIEYSKNGGAWTSITSVRPALEIPVVSGDIIQFRGDNSTYTLSTNNATGFHSSTCGFKLYGNLMSLINSTGYTSLTTIPTNNCFWAFFFHCTGLTDASDLIIPTGLKQYCFYYFFKDCTGLVTAPELPATTLPSRCYYYMFENCHSLNYVKCLATSKTSDSTTGWFNGGVASTGTFVCPSSTSWATGSSSGIPSGWTRINSD